MHSHWHVNRQFLFLHIDSISFGCVSDATMAMVILHSRLKRPETAQRRLSMLVTTLMIVLQLTRTAINPAPYSPKELERLRYTKAPTTR